MKNVVGEAFQPRQQIRRRAWKGSATGFFSSLLPAVSAQEAGTCHVAAGIVASETERQAVRLIRQWENR